MENFTLFLSGFDINDYCVGKDCNQNGKCSVELHYENGYRCECNPGYEGIDCQSVDYCKKPNSVGKTGDNICHENNANCKSLENTFTCECAVNKHWNGKKLKFVKKKF